MDLKTSEYAMEKLNKAQFKIKNEMNFFETKRWKERKYDYAYQSMRRAYNIICELQEEIENELLNGDKLNE